MEYKIIDLDQVTIAATVYESWLLQVPKIALQIKEDIRNLGLEMMRLPDEVFLEYPDGSGAIAIFMPYEIEGKQRCFSLKIGKKLWIKNK